MLNNADNTIVVKMTAGCIVVAFSPFISAGEQHEWVVFFPQCVFEIQILLVVAF